MQLAPGPIPQLAPDSASLLPEPAQFAQLANDTLADLPALDDGLGEIVSAFDAFDVPAEFDVIDLNLDTSDEGLNELSAFSTSVHVDTADNAITLAQGNLALVSAEAPAEVWNPVPDPQAGTSGTQSHPGVNGPTSLQIDNLTRPGDQNFYSGDAFRLTIQVDSGGGNFDFANKPISLTRSLNGQVQDELPIGATDQFGRLVYNSTFNDASIGDRTFGVDPSGWNTNPTVDVHVNAGPAPGGAGGTGVQPLNATIENLSTGNPALFIPGDVWREIITGPAGQPVYLDQIKDGVDQGEVFIGSTDTTGALLIAGTITVAQLGSYVERFRVANQTVPVQIQFSVVLS